MAELARLLDPTALDAVSGPHGKLRIELSSAQLGEEVEVLVPARLACARCDGGGCDGCGRSGALRLDLSEAERTTHFVLPVGAGDRLRVRLVQPLGDGAGLEQLTIEVHVRPTTALALAAPTGLTRVTPARHGGGLRSIAIGVALMLAAALALAMSTR